MTPSSPAAPPAYENPLMPNAKLRQTYAAMLRLRLLNARLAGDPEHTALAGIRDLEAALVVPTIDLGPADLVADLHHGGAINFLRGLSTQQVLHPGRRLRSPGAQAQCGAATSLSLPVSGPERLWAAIGAAAALKANAAATGARDGAVLVCYLRPEDPKPAVWSKAIAHIAAHKLPLLLVVLPARGPHASRSGKMCALAQRHRVPGMAVDQHDAVALYRVSQEAIGHARIGGGAALIECVRYLVQGQKPLRAPDAVATLGYYMLHRQVADTRWFEAEARSFSTRIAR